MISGLVLCTFMTIFVVPTLYRMMCRDAPRIATQSHD